MVTPHTQSLTDDSLIALAAQGDFAARQVLATRLRKLRWMGQTDDAKILAAKARARHANPLIHPDFLQETD